MPKKSKEITIRSSAAEYLTYIAATGDNPQIGYQKLPCKNADIYYIIIMKEHNAKKHR